MQSRDSEAARAQVHHDTTLVMDELLRRLIQDQANDAMKLGLQ